ncbi:MAG: tetratricopeptide repeat protein, partial [Candidatus Marinimicrobia bacterium]|nr:tetratricopeptide repeat protein [Candidatus Neomarinimicrobiota bacterium]
MARIRKVNYLFFVSFLSIITAQSSASISEIFFLDLGIVIEPSIGNESYNRIVEAPTEEISFQIKKAESGSVYMAASSEMLASLDRINDRITLLEKSFQQKIGGLQKENQNLKDMLMDINSGPPAVPVEPGQSMVENPVELSTASKEDPKPMDTELKTPLVSETVELPVVTPEIPSFSHQDYMSGVFAYQREDFPMALDYFSNLVLDKSTKDITNNVLYWMADSYQQLGDFNNALISLEKILEDPDSDHIDDALIKKGLLHRKLGQMEESLILFHQLVNNYPSSEYAKLARME